MESPTLERLNPPPSWRDHRGWILLLYGLVILVAACWAPTPDRDEGPHDVLQAQSGWADESACIGCHDQARTFFQTGHAQTLHLASDESVTRLLSQLSATPEARDEGTVIAVSGSSRWAQHQAGDFRSRAELDWCFGSGRHARTWVGTLSDSHGVTDLLEFRWTWYQHIQGFQLTPGQPLTPPAGYYSHLGVLFDHPKARRCFGCHSTVLPMDNGRIQEERIHAGVTCQRCHGPSSQHVESEGITATHFSIPSERLEAVKRCAECHRSPDEQPADTIRPGNPDIVRFQPIGLSQSLCFQKSEMTCLTCHDPHRTMESQDSRGIWQCLQCHDENRHDQPHCAQGHLDNCLECHMPKVNMERPIQFTDHWIRVLERESTP